jgi:hypothetical protein
MGVHTAIALLPLSVTLLVIENTFRMFFYSHVDARPSPANPCLLIPP